MTPADAAALVRAWFAEHVSTIERVLAWYGVRSREDRADLTQDVLFTGYLALLRGERIEKPRAWLWQCARKHASNYRHKGLRRELAVAVEVVNTMPTPEQIVEHRELLRLLFDCLDEEAQNIVFDARIDRLSWEEIARERGISIEQARYLYRRAIAQMEEALTKEGSARGARKSFVLPIAMDHVFEAVRAEADDVSPETRRRIGESLERRMDAGPVGAGEPDREPASSRRPTPISIHTNTTPAQPVSTGAIVGMVGGGVVLGIFLGYFGHGAFPEQPSSALARAGAVPIAAVGEAATSPSGHDAPARLVTSTDTAEGPDASPAPPLPQSTRTTAAISPRTGPTMLVERARALFAAGDVQAALALLASPDGRSLRGVAAEDYRQLLRRICAVPAARGEHGCAETVAEPAHD